MPVSGGMWFTLEAESNSLVNDFDISFFKTLRPCLEASDTAGTKRNRFGDERGYVPEDAEYAIVHLVTGIPGAAFYYSEFEEPPSTDPIPEPTPTPPPPSNPTPPDDEPLTVVAVIDSGFSPYHFDFVTHQHPWNKDGDPDNDVTFDGDPAAYIEGYPAGSTSINLTIPTQGEQDVSGLREDADKNEWAKIQVSSRSNVKLYRFSGTKVIGAVNFGRPDLFYGDNSSHGTRSAASAAGNIHGTCPECVFVLINGPTDDALAWAAGQSWIDVITNSYGNGSLVQLATLGLTRDNMYFGSPLDATRRAVESGQTIVFSAGNGFVNAFDVPMFTYWSSQKGPDWMITVGAVDPNGHQQYSGAGKPVDISSVGQSYPSTGGTTAAGTGAHSGTSNAAPVTAGTFANVIQTARSALGDVTETHSEGVIASGETNGCAACPLSDGVLTRSELQEVVFKNVRPSELAVVIDTVWPSTEYGYYYQGHGVIRGRNDPGGYAAEQQRFVNGLLTGSTLARPKGESNWFVVDSKCRQKLWGPWTGGYYSGTVPSLSKQDDPIAYAFDEWCSRTEDGALRDLATKLGMTYRGE